MTPIQIPCLKEFSLLFICFIFTSFSLLAQVDEGPIINEVNTRVIPGSGGSPDSVKQFIELLVVGCPGRGAYPGNTPDNIGPDTTKVDLRGWIIDDNNGDFGGVDGLSTGHIRFSNHPVWAEVPVGAIILIYNQSGFVLDDAFIDDPDDTALPNSVYISALNQEIGGRPLFVQDALNNTYSVYSIGDAEPDEQGTYFASDIDSWDLIFLEGTDGVQIRNPGGVFFHGLVYGSLSGGTLAPDNGGTIPAAGQGAHLNVANGTNADIFFDHVNGDGVFNDNYRHGNNFSLVPNSPGTPSRVNATTFDRNGIFITNLRNPLDAGPSQVVCGAVSRFSPTGVIGYWSEDEMWRFTGNFDLDESIFNRWEYVSGPGGGVPDDPSNVVIQDERDPNSTVRAQSGAGVYVFRRIIPNEILNTPAADISICVDSDTMQITFLGEPEASAGNDIVVCSNEADLEGSDLSSSVIFNGTWTFVEGSGPENAPVPEFLDDGDGRPETQRVSVAVAGTYAFRWRIGSDDCPAIDVVNVTFAFGDFEPIAGNDQSICGLSTSLGANTEPTGSAYWTVEPTSETTNGIRIGGILYNPADPFDPRFDDPNASISVTQPGSYTLTWNYGIDAGSSTCLTSSSVDIVFLDVANPSAGMNQTLCGFSTTLNGNPGLTSSGTAQSTQWQVINAPAGAIATFDAPTSNTTGVTVDTQGEYVFQFSVEATDNTSGLTCNAVATVRYFFIENPVAEANDETLCGLTGVLTGVNTFEDVTGDNVLDDTGLWEVIGGPDVAGVMIDDPSQFDSPIQVANEGTYQLRWTVTRTVNGVSCPVNVEIEFTFIEDFSQSGEIPEAGPDQSEVCGNIATLNANSLIVAGASAQWELDPSIDLSSLGLSSVSFDDASSPNTQVTVLPEDLGGNLSLSLNFIWTFSKTVNGVTCSAEDAVNIVFLAEPEPDAGQPDTVCIGQANYPYPLNGNLPDGTSGEWSLVSGTGNATFADETLANSSVSVDTEGLYTFRWALQNGSTCPPVGDEVSIYFLRPANSVEAGPDQLNVCEYRINLSADPAPAGDIGEWVLLNGPTQDISIANINDPNTQLRINDQSPGNYTFQWTIYRVLDGQRFCEISDQVTIAFIDQPLAEAGADQLDICFNDTQSANLSANAPSAAFTGAWTVISGPGGAITSFTPSANDPNANFNTDQSGSYTLRWTVSGGINCSQSDEVSIRFTTPLQASIAGLPNEVCGTSLILVANDASDQVGFGQWTANPSTGVIFDNPNQENTLVNVSSPGVYTFTWTIGNGTCQDDFTSNPVEFFPTLVNPQAEQDIVVYLGTSQELFADGGPDASYVWTSNDDPALANLSAGNIPNPVFTASSPNPSEFNYVVSMSTGYSLNPNDANCTVSIPVRVRIFTELNVPNVFTPNGDGQYDTWQIPLLQGFPDASVSVFNRWGDVVFKSTGYAEAWDGRFNGNPVPHATYYYVIDLQNGQEPSTGYVVVTR